MTPFLPFLPPVFAVAPASAGNAASPWASEPASHGTSPWASQAGRAIALPVLVKDGFSWRVLIFGWLGLFGRNRWIAALLAGAMQITLGAVLARTGLALPVLIVVHLALGTFAAEIAAWELRLKGYRQSPPVMGDTAGAALLRFMDRNGAVA